MKDNPVSAYARHDLRRLWPVVSSTLYPESERLISEAVKHVETTVNTGGASEDIELLNIAMQKLQASLLRHNREVATLINERLTAYPYGSKKFPADHFEVACEKHALSSAEIKSEWNNIRLLARRCFGKTRGTPDDRLALARLNAVEQDVLYVLFVEHQYMCPLVLKPSE